MSASISSFIRFLLFINIIFAGITVFRDRNRDITAIWAWLLVLVLLPGIGFIIYAFLGRKLSKKDIRQFQSQEEKGLTPYIMKHQETLAQQRAYLKMKSYPYNIQVSQARLFLKMSEMTVSAHNQVEMITDGEDKFRRLIADIRQAKDHVHLCYYIFKYDAVGQTLIEELKQKVKEGVAVRLLYDPIGGRHLSPKILKELRAAGIEELASFGSHFWLLNFRLNYRNHRKMVIIDGKIGYTGGFNVGDEYLGKDKKFGYWRDTHVRICGDAVSYIQARFFMDWNASYPEQPLKYNKNYFPSHKKVGDTSLQIISSGPDDERQDIKFGYINMISSAKSSIYIQTPYFIPDDALMEALKIAIYAGVDVKLMIPCKPDHPFVYSATLSYVEELVKLGAEIYTYDNGFIHAKTIVIDGKILSVGTANFDIRSFKLNFELNAFIYDEDLAEKQMEIFQEDIEHSSLLTMDTIENRSGWDRLRQQFSRLLSPIL